MNNPSLAARLPVQSPSPPAGSQGGAVSWPAIIAGAMGAAALSLILLVLGTGLGLSAVSPWSDRGASAASFGTSTILWVTLTQVAAAGMGGYIAGRLRTRWADTHADEVYFRDTAHGFLAWALATLLTAALLTSAIGSIVGGGAKAGTAAAAAVTSSAMLSTASAPTASDASANPIGYAVDALFRREPASTATPVPPLDPLMASEVARILTNGIAHGLSADDATYVGQLVAQRTGLAQADAQKRVTDGLARIQTSAKEAEAATRDAADKARRASAYAALWLFVSLLIGAFCASLAATFGGRRRDQF